LQQESESAYQSFLLLTRYTPEKMKMAEMAFISVNGSLSQNMAMPVAMTG
jgi:hypothetical protein